MNKKAFDCVLTETENVLSRAHARIEAHISSKNECTFGVTQLSKDIAKETGSNFTFAYALITAYVSQRDDIEVKRGPKGGIVPRKIKVEEVKEV